MRHSRTRARTRRSNNSAQEGPSAPPLAGPFNWVSRSKHTPRLLWTIVWLGLTCCSTHVVLGMSTTLDSSSDFGATTLNTSTTTTTTTSTTSTTKLCLPAGCFGESCDHWDSSPITPFDCLELEGTHGCDCSGCDCAFTVFPAPDTTAAPIAIITTPADVSTTRLPNTTAAPSDDENVCSDGTVSKVCFGDMEADELVALFGLPAFWLTVMVLVGFSHHIAALARGAADKDNGGSSSSSRKGKKGGKKSRLGLSSSSSSASSSSSRLEAGRLAPASPSKGRKILNYSFSKVARMTFLTHSRSWTAFCEREYAEMEKIDFQGVPLNGFRSAMTYGFDLYTKWSGTALISVWRSAVQASCFAGLLLWVLYFLKQLQDWDILDGTNSTLSDDGGAGVLDGLFSGSIAAAVTNDTASAFSATTLLPAASGDPATEEEEEQQQDPVIDTSTTLYAVRSHIAAVAEMNSAIEEYVSFMLIFYTILNVDNYLRCFKYALKLQESLENLALNFVAVYPAFQTTKRSKYQLYRYLNVMHFFSYAYLIPDFVKEANQFPLYLANVGLLTKKEAKKMENLKTPLETMRGWLVELMHNKDLNVALMTSTKNRADAERIRAFLVNLLATVTHNMQELKSATELYPPLSFVQIMRLLMDVYILIMPVMLVNTMYIAADPPLRIQVAPVLACFLLTLFYNGLMRLVVIIRMPFGDRIDQFHVSGALIIMDQKIFKILTQDSGEHLYGRELRRVAAKYDRRHWTKNQKKLNLTFVEETKPLWDEVFDAHHNAYYYHNNKTGESSWVSPSNVHDTYSVKTPANKATQDFMTLYRATVKIQAIFRRKLGIRKIAVMLKENAMLDADGGD